MKRVVLDTNIVISSALGGTLEIILDSINGCIVNLTGEITPGRCIWLKDKCLIDLLTGGHGH